MLIRIVRMEFMPGKINDFLMVFDRSKEQIRNFQGCLHLELLKDYHKKNVYFTYSHWEDANALENYRKSELFQETWQKTKTLFSEKPEAFSLLKDDDQPG